MNGCGQMGPIAQKHQTLFQDHPTANAVPYVLAPAPMPRVRHMLHVHHVRHMYHIHTHTRSLSVSLSLSHSLTHSLSLSLCRYICASTHTHTRTRARAHTHTHTHRPQMKNLPSSVRAVTCHLPAATTPITTTLHIHTAPPREHFSLFSEGCNVPPPGSN
jgi:hypothetical protein